MAGVSVESPPDDSVRAVVLVAELCRDLEDRDIRYCHWKSNDALERSATAENDLDLLIHTEDEARFREVLAAHGFRLGVAPPARSMPGVEDYFGYDSDANLLVHVHAHYRLIIGDDRTKNYRLPLESLYLESTSHSLCFRIPRPEVEFIGFVVRMTLKRATWEAVLEGLGKLTKAERRELAELESRIDEARLRERLAAVPFLEPWFEPCVKALEPGASAWSRVRAAGDLRRALAAHARRRPVVDLFVKAWRRVVQGVRRRLPMGNSKPRLATGGSMVAIVGGDGAGKTTVVNELYTTWRKELDVRLEHLGKPGWSWTTIGVRAALKLVRVLGGGRYVSSAEVLFGDGAGPAFPGYGFVFRELCISRDRYRAYRKARRIATAGAIVLCDRFPLPGLSMDGPVLRRALPGAESSWLLGRLCRLEESYYRSISPPDVLFLLKVNPDIAVERKTDEEPNYVRARSTEVWNFVPQDSPHFEIDASRSREDVAAEIRRILWRAL